jgi:hypothetical protein
MTNTLSKTNPKGKAPEPGKPKTAAKPSKPATAAPPKTKALKDSPVSAPPTLQGWNSESGGNPRYEEMRMAHNPYLASLLNPFGVTGVLIPGPESAVVALSTTRRVYCTVNSNGEAFLTWGIGLRRVADSIDTDKDWFNAAFMGGSPTIFSERDYHDDAPPEWEGRINAANTFQGNVSDPSEGLFDKTDVFSRKPTGSRDALGYTTWGLPEALIDFIYENMSSLQVVSAGLAVNTTASITNASGAYTIASVPRNFCPNGEVLATTTSNPYRPYDATQWDTFPGSIVEPLNKGKGVTALYAPTDMICLQNATIPVADGNIVAFEPQEIPETFRPGFIFCYVSGAAPATSLVFDIRLNLQGVPKNNSILQSFARRGVNDEMALDHAFDVLARSWKVFAGTDLADNSGPNEASATTGASVAQGMVAHSSINVTAAAARGYSIRHTKGAVRTLPSGARPGTVMLTRVPPLGKNLVKKIEGVTKKAAPYVRMIDNILSSLV